jgi:TetR/AcrR family transcriptional regulator, mexJK operon transcriptional repressor
MVTVQAGPFGTDARSVSERKREEIQRAALTLFTRDGYERTSVDAIAAEAGVSKRTVYNHFGDKENLFLLVTQRTFTWMIGLVEEVVGRHLDDLRDPAALEQTLVETLREMSRTITQLPERAALIRLLITEARRFPVLTEPWRARGTITDVISARLARLADRGLLSFGDPVEATQHLTALTLNQLNTRSLFGTFEISAAETERVIRSGVHVFLLAYAPRA